MGVCVRCLQHGPPHLVNLVCPSPPPVGQAQPGVAPGQPTLLSGQPQGQPGLPPPHPQMATTPQPQQVAVMPGQFLRCYCQGGRGKLKKLMIIINGSFCSVTNYRCLGSFAMLICVFGFCLDSIFWTTQPFVWWCIVSQSLMQEGWFAIVKVKVCRIRTGLFDASTELLIFLCPNLVWWYIIIGLCEKIALLCRRSRL